MTCSIKDRVKVWKEAFEEDENAIVPTLCDFAWNYAVYVSISCVVDLALMDDEDKKQLNFPVFNFINESFWRSAIMTIRCLLDRGSLNGERGVNSLRSILKDIKEYRSMLTRRAYIADISGLEYDIEKIEREHDEFLFKHTRNGQIISVPRELNSQPTRIRHEQFDFLSGIDSSNRSPDDVVRLEVFDQFEERLGRLDIIAKHASRHIAHAATRVSRESGGNIGKWGDTEVKEAIRILTEIAELTGRWFINSSVGNILPVPQYNQFEYLDKAMMQPDTLSVLHDNWNNLDQQMDQWSRIVDTDLL